VAALAISVVLLIGDIKHQREVADLNVQEGKLRLYGYRSSIDDLIRIGFFALGPVHSFGSAPQSSGLHQPERNDRPNEFGAPPPDFENGAPGPDGRSHRAPADRLWSNSSLLENVRLIPIQNPNAALHEFPLRMDSSGTYSLDTASGTASTEGLYYQTVLRQQMQAPRHWSDIKYTESGRGADQSQPGLLLTMSLVRGDSLAGLATGFIPADKISGTLERGNFHAMTALISEDGDVIGCEDLPQESRDWLKQRVVARTLGPIADSAQGPLDCGRWTTLWTGVPVPGDHRWWLVYQYDNEFLSHRSLLSAAVSDKASAAFVFIFGLLLAFMVLRLRRRNAQLASMVTDIKGRETALEGTISLLNATLESSTDGIVAISNSGTIVNFNQRLFTVWRLREDTWPFGREGEQPDALSSQVQNVGAFLRPPDETEPDGSMDNRPVLLHLKDGRILEQSSHVQTVDGAKVGTVWSFRDVTARERSDSAIKQHLHFLQVLIDAIPNPVYYKDIRGRYLGCNTAFEKVIGRSRDEIIGKSVIEVGGVPFAQQYYGHDAGMLRDQGIQSFEGPLVYADGTVHQVVFNRAVFFNADETLGGIVGALVDISDRKMAEMALRENEAKYRAAFDSANIGFAILTDVFHDCNRALCEMWGCPRQDLIGRSPSEFSPEFQPDGRPSTEAAQAHIDAALLGEQQFFYWHHKKLNGELVECEVALKAVTIDGKPALLASVSDIGARKKAEEVRRQSELALQQSEKYYRGLIENSTDLVTVVAAGGAVLYTGPSVQRLLGYGPADLIGKCAYDFMIEDDVAQVQSKLKPLLTNPSQVQLIVSRFRHSDGTYRIFESMGHGTVDMDGNPVIVVNSRDITERTAIEDRIRASEENYRSLFEDAADGIIVVNQDGRYLDANAAACRMLGYSHDELLAMRARDFRIPEELDRYEVMREQILSGKPVVGEWHFRRKDGSLIEIEATTKMLLDGRLQAFYRDLTERRASERALRESELWLRTLVEATSDVFFTVGADHTILSLSPAFETVSGWRTSDWIGRPFTGLVHPQDIENTKSAMQKNEGKSGSSDITEIRILASDGSYRTMEIKFALVQRDDPKTLYVGVARDITERRKAQSEVRKLSRAIEQSPVSVVITDRSGAIEYVNPKFTELTGYSGEEVRGQNSRILKSGLMHDDVYAELWRTISSGRAWQGELLNRKKSGETYWESTFISCLTNSDGEITHYVAVKQDISERIIRELETRKLSAAVVQSANLIIITDTSGIIEYVNPRFTQVSGYSLAEVVGLPMTALNTGANDPEEIATMWNQVRSGQMWKGVVLTEQKSGKPYYIRRTASPILDAAGSLISILFLGEDITTEMEAQQKAMEADKLAAVGVLAAGVSHEFKNYLGGIIGNASFALDEINGEAEDALSLARDTLSQIIGMSEKANQVAMSLLTYSKARPEEFSAADLKPLVMNTINLVEKELRNRSIELVTYFEPTPEVNVSASKIQQLLLNLLLNAEHAIEQSGVITVALTADSQYVKLKVGDTGCGIPPANLSRIFDPFFSTKGVWGKDKVVGTGMGLAICRNVAREHHGDLTVESTIGVGTTFILQLPLRPEIDALETARIPGAKARRFVVFSLDKGIVGKYFKDAAALGVELLAVDDVRKLTGDLATTADLVICDARFSGKIELSRIVTMCLEAGMPYVMVNCGAMEYQLAHLYEKSLANFRELPELQRVNALVPEQKATPASISR
jgi:PAS domain S-box-containing protein